MKASQIPLFTMKEDPKDAQVASHRLLTRAGYIRKQAAGLYVFLPFGYEVFRKVEEIVRQEMNRFGAVEVHLPVITPAELWQQSGRWDIMGAEMMRMSDRHNNLFALGPTHEESITWLAAQFLQSYKQLPINLYQIGTKYRDEIRPRYGLIRCREFTMKDAYSFHMSDESLDETYQKMREAYRAIFERCGLATIAVEADSGNMGGSGSEEFMVASEIGEETLLLCENERGCGYRSNQEKTPFVPREVYHSGEPSPPQLVETPTQKTIEEVTTLLQQDPTLFIKTVIYETDESVILAFIPGDRDLSEVKLKNIAGGTNFAMASAETIRAVTGAEPGFAGPANLPVKDGEKIQMKNAAAQRVTKTVQIFFDHNIKNRGGLISGANKTGFHLKGLTDGRDFQSGETKDLVNAQAGDICPRCREQRLKSTKGIEVGHIFKLGRKYTQSMGLTVLDQNGKPFVPTMGCYGIGIGRTVATVVEQNHDEKGIIWPESISAYKYYLIGISKTAEEKALIEVLYQNMIDRGLSVYYDDRDERPGVKFNDADLVGFPWQVVAGKTYFEKGLIELKNRRTGEKTEVKPQELN